MGIKNTVVQQNNTLRWAESYTGRILRLNVPLSLTSIKETYLDVLKNYFALAGLARSKSAPLNLSQRADSKLFGTRVRIERAMKVTIFDSLRKENRGVVALFQGRFFGQSKKQGISLRAPLSTCNPTKLCASGCYAHDALDATPNAVVRGVINGVIAEHYELNIDGRRDEVMSRLRTDIGRAIRHAKSECENQPENWSRPARIRFSHVGEIVAYPEFANQIAQEIVTLSHNTVIPVIYTRHPNARQLDPKLWVINFTLDKSSLDRSSWAPPKSRLVFSAFGGEINKDVAVNFLEHHRWSHSDAAGTGTICPTTLPQTETRTCDAVRCNLCFEPTNGLEN